MKLTNAFLFAIAASFVACGTQNNNSEESKETTPTPVTSQTMASDELNAREALKSSIPAAAIVRVPLAANGELDMERAELRVPSTSVSTDADLAKAFESAAPQKVSSSVSPDDLNGQTSTNSWAILPWRRMMELTVFGGAAGGARRHHGHRSCGHRVPCAQPVQVVDPCCVVQRPVPVVTQTTTCCTTTTIQTGGYNQAFAPVYFNQGGHQWDYNFNGQQYQQNGYHYLNFQNGWL